jgi:UDP-N-acetylmuramyl pentapeptide phosphotransferase/UDP-N-acetylglucosamine-1-phosphate transferase
MMAAVIAFGLTIVLCPPVLACLRRWGVLDVPGQRSSHAEPIPRGSGIAPAVGATVALATASALDGQARAGLLAVSLAFGAVGFLDDVVGVPALRRLALQVVAAALAVWWLVASWDGSQTWRVAVAGGALLWLVSYVNAFNFMDGIDGMSVAQVLVAGTAWSVVGHVENVPALVTGSLVITGAALGFAPFNFPRARMFLGDGGSYFFGAWLAGLAVMAVLARVPPEAVLAPLSLYLADTGTTLLRRVRRGDVWYLPHREHAYQRLVQLGWTHSRTTLTVGAVMAVVSGLGALALTDSVALRVAGDGLVVAVLAGYLWAPVRLGGARRRSVPGPGAVSAEALADPEIDPTDSQKPRLA